MITAATVKEVPLCMAVGDEQLLGVLTLPPQGTPVQTALVIVVGGPQYRAGAHRQFVQLARAAAAAGWPALRFDVRGMGDSTGTALGFENQHADICAALDALSHACPGVRTVVLWGLCDGASAAAMYMGETRDPRVGGLLLLNPWVHSESLGARARLRHWYWQRALQGSFWRKLLLGQVGPNAVRNVWRDALASRRAGAGNLSGMEKPDFRDCMLRGILAARLPTEVWLSSQDATAQTFDVFCRSTEPWAAAMRKGRLALRWLDGADHTLTRAEHRAELVAATLRQLAAAYKQ